MRRRNASLPALLAGLALLVGVAPTAAQQVELAASPPENATVFRTGAADWNDVSCNGATKADITVPPGEWLELPVGWFAVDETTAQSNWESMTYAIELAGSPLKLPRGVRRVSSTVHLECPGRTLDGHSISPVVYVPPSNADRTFTVVWAITKDLNDGWSDFRKGQTLKVAVRVHSGAAKAAPPAVAAADIAAAPPAGVTVHRFTVADWLEQACAGKPEADLTVPAGEWVELPILWIAKDEATTRANLKSMTYSIALGDKTVALPAGVRWETGTWVMACPKQTYTGFGIAPVIYLPPSASERTVRLDYLINEDVNDGWDTYKKGKISTPLLRLHPAAAKPAP